MYQFFSDMDQKETHRRKPMNNINLIGRLTRKAEIRQTPEGKTYAYFTLAVNRRKKSGGTGNEADFLPCLIWGKSAENLVAWTDKGTQISLEGELRSRTYDKDGQKQYVVEVWSNYFTVLHQPQTSSGN